MFKLLQALTSFLEQFYDGLPLFTPTFTHFSRLFSHNFHTFCHTVLTPFFHTFFHTFSHLFYTYFHVFFHNFALFHTFFNHFFTPSFTHFFIPSFTRFFTPFYTFFQTLFSHQITPTFTSFTHLFSYSFHTFLHIFHIFFHTFFHTFHTLFHAFFTRFLHIFTPSFTPTFKPFSHHFHIYFQTFFHTFFHAFFHTFFTPFSQHFHTFFIPFFHIFFLTLAAWPSQKNILRIVSIEHEAGQAPRSVWHCGEERKNTSLSCPSRESNHDCPTDILIATSTGLFCPPNKAPSSGMCRRLVLQVDRCFGRTYCAGSGGGIAFLRNVGKHLPDCTASHPRIYTEPRAVPDETSGGTNALCAAAWRRKRQKVATLRKSVTATTAVRPVMA